jgi:hypothetical protein
MKPPVTSFNLAAKQLGRKFYLTKRSQTKENKPDNMPQVKKC